MEATAVTNDCRSIDLTPLPKAFLHWSGAPIYIVAYQEGLGYVK